MSPLAVAKTAENSMTSIYLAKFMFSQNAHKNNTIISQSVLGSFRETPLRL